MIVSRGQPKIRHLAGGVVAPTCVDPWLDIPLVVKEAQGCKLYVEGKGYLYDLCMSNGAAILGHQSAILREAVNAAMSCGGISGYNTPTAEKLAAHIVSLVPCAELVRFMLSGSESTFHAIRLARAYRGRNKIVKFSGHYHGCHAWGLMNGPGAFGKLASSGLVERIPCSSGGSSAAIKEIIVLPFNAVNVAQRVLDSEHEDIAAVILEPVNINSGCILPKPEFIRLLRTLTARHDIILIFDEILSGFRTGCGCAQADLGVKPDLCILGKALGGGVPISAIVGIRGVMECLAPDGECFVSGTYSGSLLGMRAGLACLDQMRKATFHTGLMRRTERFVQGMTNIFSMRGISCPISCYGDRFSLHFGLKRVPQSAEEQSGFNLRLHECFRQAAYRNGVYMRGHWHHGISDGHSEEDIDNILSKLDDAVREMTLEL